MRRRVSWADRIPEAFVFAFEPELEGERVFTVIKNRDVIQFHDEYISGPKVTFRAVKLLLERGRVIS